MLIYNINYIEFWIYFGLFIVFLLISIVLGQTILKVAKLKDLPNGLTLLLSLTLGILLWLFTSYLFGYLKIRVVSFLFVIIGIFLLYKQRLEIINYIKRFFKKLIKTDLVFLVITVIGTTLQVFVVALSGLRTSDGVVFHSLNGVDGIMHLAFSDFLKTYFPPIEPGMSGTYLTNYHYWVDFLNAEVSRIFFIPTIHLNFQFFPLLISIGMALAIYYLVSLLGGGTNQQRWALFLHFFAGNATHFFSFLLHGEPRFYTPSFDSGFLHFFNTPQAIARLYLYICLILLIIWYKRKSFRILLLTIPCIASLIDFKIYYGIYMILAVSIFLGLLFINTLIKRRKINNNLWESLLYIFLLNIVVLLIYLPTNKNSGGLFWAPLEWPKLLLGAANLDWNEWWLRMQVYEAYKNYRNLIIYNGMAVGIFLISFFGTRIIGLMPNPERFKQKKLRSPIWLIYPSLYIIMFLGLFTLQASGGGKYI